MAEVQVYKNKKFLVIQDQDPDYVIYVLEKFEESQIVEFKSENFFLRIGTVQLPNGCFAYGFQSNVIHNENQQVNGSLINSRKTESLFDAGKEAYKYLKKHARFSNSHHAVKIFTDLERYYNPSTLF